MDATATGLGLQKSTSSVESSLEVTSPGNITFTEGQSLGSSNFWGIELGDLDDDGDPDALISNKVTQCGSTTVAMMLEISH